LTEISASWIWAPSTSKQPYNKAIFARKTFRCGQMERADLIITADSWYRVTINGQWIADGPCRSWPEHFRYDELDVSHAVSTGQNVIEILARYWGCGTFHQIPQRPGLLAQLELHGSMNEPRQIVTDEDWEVAEARWFISNTPKVSIQMEPAELVDARLREPIWRKAEVVCAAAEGPWRNLGPRDVALMSRTQVDLKRYVGAQVVNSQCVDFTFPVGRLLHPGVIEANGSTSLAGAAATLLRSATPQTTRLRRGGA